MKTSLISPFVPRLASKTAGFSVPSPAGLERVMKGPPERKTFSGGMDNRGSGGKDVGPTSTWRNMNEKKYNGWTNYETWAVGLWIDNEQGSYNYWREQAEQCYTDTAKNASVFEGMWSRRSAAASTLGDQIKEAFEEERPLADQANIYSDLLTAALGEVDWREIAFQILADITEPEDPSVQIISGYSRAQAIEDGVLIDISKTAKEAGFKYPMVLTSAVWGKYVIVPEGAEGQDEQGRLWDILNMLRFAIRNDESTNEVSFSLYVNNSGKPESVYLKSICGPGDDAEPVITIMLPTED